MKLIPCPFCSEKLLLVPDAKAMDRAIDNHAEKARKKHYPLLPGDVADELTVRVLDALTLDPLAVKGC